MLRFIAIVAAGVVALNMAQATTTMAQENSKPELVVYTYDSFASEWGPGPQLKTAFEKTCNCRLTFVGLDSSIGILGRIQLEGADSKADIALGLDTNLMAVAAETGLFLEHDLDLKARDTLALPAEAGYWDDPLFVPFDWGYFAFNYDKTRLKAPPRSFEDLLASENDLKIVIQDARTSTPGLGLMLWVNAVYGDEAPQIWERLAPKLVTITKGWWEAYSMFLEGEADMVLSYSTSPAYHLHAEGKDHYAAALFDEGHYMQIEVAGVLKSSQKPALARLFLQKLLEKEMQSVLPTTNWMYPAARSGTIPQAFSGLIAPEKHLLFSPERVAQMREAWVKAWINGLSG